MTSISEKTITESIDNDYREYAMYTISNRAIPCYIDGMKPVHII
jgi:DNA gyrase/topoisomerase IV subunit A